MNRLSRILVSRTVASLAVLAGATAWSANALAQDTTVVTEPAPAQTVVVQPVATPTPVAAETHSDYAGPNRALIGSGLVTFAIPYVASAIVAGTSSRDEDKNLYIPVAGPWIDLGERSACGGSSGISCDGETFNKVLLVADGVFQGLGVLQILGGFVMPEKRTVTTTTTTASSKVQFAPVHYRNGGGLGVVGQF